MNARRSLLVILALGAVALSHFAFVPSARAEAGPSVPLEPMVDVIGLMLKVAESFSPDGMVGKFVAALTTISGVCAIFIKPFWDRYVYPGLVEYVQSTVTKKDDEILDRLLSNKGVKVFLYLLNLIAHIKFPIVNAAGEAVSPTRAGLPPPSQPCP